MKAGGSRFCPHDASIRPPDEARSGRDRRQGERRAPQRRFDPLFAATLVNQLVPAETDYVRGYGAGAAYVRCGLVVNRSI